MSTLFRLSVAGRLSLALALFLGLVAAGALAAARGPAAPSKPRGAGLAAEIAHAQSTGAPDADAPIRGITVIGEGDASGAPDVANVNLGVQSEGKTAREALDQNTSAMNGVIDALKRQGIPPSDLRTTGVNLFPLMAQPRPGDSAPPQVVGYRVSNTLNVTVATVTQLGDVLDAAVTAGANTANGVRFTIRDDGALRRKALEAAAQAARAKADTLAGALGGRVTGVQSVVEEAAAGPPPRELQALSATPGSAPVPVQPGEFNVHARIRVVFTVG